MVKSRLINIIHKRIKFPFRNFCERRRHNVYYSLTQVNECTCQLSLVSFPCESKNAKNQISINLIALKVGNMSKTRYASILSPFILICNMLIFYGFTQSAFIFYRLLDTVIGIGYLVLISCICSWRRIYRSKNTDVIQGNSFKGGL